MNKLNTLLLASTLAFPTLALANHDGDHCDRHGADMFTEADSNKDGRIDKAEADKDSNGKLDREEAKSLPHVSKNFDAIDADKDGTVDRDEVHNYMKNKMNK